MDIRKLVVSTLKKWGSDLGLTKDEQVFLLLFFLASLLGGAIGCGLAYWMIDVWVCS
jgi:hypothetical protein